MKHDRQVQAHVIHCVRDYIAAFPDVTPITIFQGAYQTGKTHMAWAIARARPAGALVTTMSDMIRDLREPWRNREGPSEAQRLLRYRNRTLLVVDELSRHSLLAQNVTPHLYDVIARRLDEGRPTILTTNESDNVLAALLGAALGARVQRHGGVIDFGTRSWEGP
jgi:DNA replication protein DnaC